MDHKLNYCEYHEYESHCWEWIPGYKSFWEPLCRALQTFDVEGFFMNNSSPIKTDSYDENMILFAQIWQTPPMSTHSSLDFPNMLHFETTSQRSISTLPSNTTIGFVILAWAFIFWKFIDLRRPLEWCFILLQLKHLPLDFLVYCCLWLKPTP